MSKHFNEAVEGDDGGLVICRGCKARSTYAAMPNGKCPTPYKSDRALLDESLAREQALQQCLTAANERMDLLEPENTGMRTDAERYRWLRDRDLNSIHLGGVFAGKTPQNIVLNGEDLDQMIDAAIQSAEGGEDDH
ncbi:hypothetical protein [Pseudomonas pergaminensis]